MNLPLAEALGVATALLAQLVGAIWWASKLSSEVRALRTELAAYKGEQAEKLKGVSLRQDHHEEAVSAIEAVETRLVRVERRQDQHEMTLSKMSGVLERLDERSAGIAKSVGKLEDHILNKA